MTPEDIDKLTLGEVRAIAEQASKALEAMRAVQSLMGGAPHAVASAPQAVATQLTPEQQEILDARRVQFGHLKQQFKPSAEDMEALVSS